MEKATDLSPKEERHGISFSCWGQFLSFSIDEALRLRHLLLLMIYSKRKKL